SGEKASAATPYTVSVGSTASSPLRNTAVASAIPAARCAASVQSYRALIAQSFHPPARAGARKPWPPPSARRWRPTGCYEIVISDIAGPPRRRVRPVAGRPGGGGAGGGAPRRRGGPGPGPRGRGGAAGAGGLGRQGPAGGGTAAAGSAASVSYRPGQRAVTKRSRPARSLWLRVSAQPRSSAKVQ